MKRNRIGAALGAFALGVAQALAPTAAQAQTPAWPTGPVRIVVPFAAGGNTDAVARMVAIRLNELTQRPVTVENRAGGGGGIAMVSVANATPDGHTLAMSSTGPHTILPHLLRNPGFDPIRDFAPISNVSSNALILMVHPSVPAGNLKELIELARREPGRLTFGSGGVGSTTHLAGEMLKTVAGIDMVHVPFRGGAPLTIAARAGDVQVSFNNMAEAVVQVRAGYVRGLAVTSLNRQPQAPELPTVAESGYPGFEAGPWNGLVAPGKTPVETVRRISELVRQITAEPAFREQLVKIGSVPIGDSPEQFQATIRDAHQRWGQVIRDAGIRPE
jgi:tripartite-type tricarboxylate transporter receptor subunit TctC